MAEENRTYDENVKLEQTLESVREQDEKDRILAQSVQEQEKNITPRVNEIEIDKPSEAKPRALKKGLKREDMILPASIEKEFTEVEGKFYAKGSDRLIFQDTESKLKTSATDAKTVHAIVEYSKAKQWDTLKISGSKDFRKEVFLQAESQGIKTQGYTPTKLDLVLLAELTEERSKNTVTELGPKIKEREQKNILSNEKENGTESQNLNEQAPRANLNKNQAELHDSATRNIETNTQALQEKVGDIENVSRAAYWRGILLEDTKGYPESERDSVIARFDDLVKNKSFVDSLDKTNEVSIEHKVAGHQIEPKNPEHTL